MRLWRQPSQSFPSAHLTLHFHALHSYTFSPQLYVECLQDTRHSISGDTVVKVSTELPALSDLQSSENSRCRISLPTGILIPTSPKVDSSTSIQGSSSPRLQLSEEIHSVAQPRNLGTILYNPFCLIYKFQPSTKFYCFYPLNCFKSIFSLSLLP